MCGCGDHGAVGAGRGLERARGGALETAWLARGPCARTGDVGRLVVGRRRRSERSEESGAQSTGQVVRGRRAGHAHTAEQDPRVAGACAQSDAGRGAGRSRVESLDRRAAAWTLESVVAGRGGPTYCTAGAGYREGRDRDAGTRAGSREWAGECTPTRRAMTRETRTRSPRAGADLLRPASRRSTDHARRVQHTRTDHARDTLTLCSCVCRIFYRRPDLSRR